MAFLAHQNSCLTPSDGCQFALVVSRLSFLSCGADCPHSVPAKAFIYRNVGVPIDLTSSLRLFATGPNSS